jgi:hypothetical protein
MKQTINLLIDFIKSLDLYKVFIYSAFTICALIVAYQLFN